MIMRDGPMKNVINNACSTTRRPFNKITAANNNNFTKKVNTVKGTRVNTTRPKAVLSAVNGNKGNAVKASACWVWHMIGNKSYLTYYEEIDGGFVAFGGNSKDEKIIRKDFKLTDESDILLKVPRKDNMYSVNLKNVIPQGGFTCLFVKATSDEFNLWYRRLGHKTCLKLHETIILNTIDHIGKFDGKADEGFFVGYSTNSKAFRVFNSRTRIVEENLHVQFSENTSNIAGSGPNWLFDIDALTKSMNYKPVVAGNQSNGNACTKACDEAGKSRMEAVLGKDYILLPMWPADLLFSQNSNDSPDAGFKPLGEEEKKDAEDPGNESGNPTEGKNSEVPSTEEPIINQEKNDNINSTNNINTASDGNNSNNVNAVSSTINVAGTEVNVVDLKTSIELPNDPNMPELEDIVYSDDDEDVGAEANMNNLDAFMPVSPIPTTRIHKDHPVDQIIRDLNSAPQTRRMTKNLKEHGLFSSVQQRTNHKDFQNCLFACFLSQEEPKKVWTLADLPNGKRAIGTKWVYRNKDERGIVIKNKARLVAQGYTQEEGIDYNEVFAYFARIEAIRLFLAYASFKDFVVYQMDVKSDFLYGKIEEKVYVCQPPGFEDPDFPDRVNKVEKALYGLHQAPRAWYETLSTYLLDNGFREER
ncbi:putative ribonuclease H-like domain-containing protein [Tanacetum coccineum]